MNLPHRVARKLRRVLHGSGTGGATTANPSLTYQAAGASAKWYIHELAGYVPDADRFTFREDDGGGEAGRAAIVDRVIRYGQRLSGTTVGSTVGEHRDMWLFIAKGHEPLRRAVEAGDAATTSTLLRQMATGPLVAGFMNFEPYDRLRDNPDARRSEATHLVDKLLSLGESLGCQPVQGVEQGERGYRNLDVDEMLGRIRDRVGFDLAPPAAGGGSYGFRSGGAVYNVKDVNAIYTAHQSARLVDGRPTRTVAEIGGGTGTLGYYLRRAGFDRVSIYDLPTVSVIQAYFLLRSLGPTDVWLDGEEPSGEAAVRVRPFWRLADEPDRSFDLVVNQDSLPEIERSAALGYLDLIKAKAARFYSINQEGQAPDQFANPQSVVYQLAEASGGFRRAFRYPHWMRTGYVEECYDVVTS